MPHTSSRRSSVDLQENVASNVAATLDVQPARPKLLQRLSAHSILSRKSAQEETVDKETSAVVETSLRTQLSTSSLGNDTSLDEKTSSLGQHKYHSVPNGLTTSGKGEYMSEIVSITTAAPGSIASRCEYAVANTKRNEDFHALFRSVPDYDMLIQDYKCALQKDILLQGHIYVSEHHLCFKSNIFGWVTNLVIGYSEITGIEKRMTARIIPNGIQISTHTAKHVFASFLSRDQAYDQMMRLWESHQRLPSPDYASSLVESVTSNETDEVDEIDDESHVSAATGQSDEHQQALPEEPPKKRLDSGYAEQSASQPKEAEPRIIPVNRTKSCPCTASGEHYSNIALDETYPGTVESMYKILFTSDFMKGFLKEVQQSRGMIIDTDDDVDLSRYRHGVRECSYRRPMAGTNGVKLVKCHFKDQRLHRKLPHYISILTTISTPSMPISLVKSRTCLTRARNNKVRVLVTYRVEFTKGGLVSSIIEKDATDAHLRFYTQLHTVLQKPDLVKKLTVTTPLSQPADKGQGSDRLLLLRSKAGNLVSEIHFTQILVICMIVALLANMWMAYKIFQVADTLHEIDDNQLHRVPQGHAERLEWVQGAVDDMEKSILELQKAAQDQRDLLHHMLP
ncbi:hypothetical protein DFQ28_009800 [Apophysomyces sp. BC1034]|nr:hypothetical protein DFQ28_009800 [Apophysomyces sp. BC1034]